MKQAFSLFLSFLIVIPTGAQNISGFLDFRDYFYAFDAGTFTELETLPPRGFVMGGNRMVYVATNGELKVHQDGTTTTIDQNIATLPTVTDHFIGYTTAGVFKLFDGKKVKVLCANTGASVVEDSVAAFLDNAQHTLNIHYRGLSLLAEDALMENAVQKWRAGDNTIAWISAMSREFRVFYRGEILTLGSLVTDMEFEAGLDMVAYQDPSDKGLKAFYKGDVLDLEAIMPIGMKMGKGLFAYTDVSGSLKVFQNGEVHTALSYTPEEFHVVDSLVVIRDGGQCKVFHDGKLETVLSYWPSRWMAQWGTFVYIDPDRTLGAWQAGVRSTVMQREPIKKFTLDRGLITVQLTNNAVKIWWRGKLYEM